MKPAPPTEQWWKQANRYLRFTTVTTLPTEEDAQRMFEHETYGWHPEMKEGLFKASPNPYAVGKKWLNVQVAAWRRDIAEGLFCKAELYRDPKYADDQEWLHSILDDVPAGSLEWAYRPWLRFRHFQRRMRQIKYGILWGLGVSLFVLIWMAIRRL